MHRVKLKALKESTLIDPNDDLASIINKSINNNGIDIESGDVVVVAQKIISKCENRYVELKNIQPSKQATDLAKTLNRDPAFIQIIQNESKKIISTDKNVIIVEHKLGFININAGIDRSNILQNDDVVLLLPENPSKSAKDLQSAISANFQRDIALIVTDSMTRPFRSGVSNFALASANIPSLIDLKGDSDIYGNILQSTEIAIADELAAAAGLLMGQGSEKQPVVIIKGFDKKNYSTNDAFDLVVDEDEDLYR